MAICLKAYARNETADALTDIQHKRQRANELREDGFPDDYIKSLFNKPPLATQKAVLPMRTRRR